MQTFTRHAATKNRLALPAKTRFFFICIQRTLVPTTKKAFGNHVSHKSYDSNKNALLCSPKLDIIGNEV